MAQTKEMVTANCCTIAATILLFYDYLLTIQDELQCIWSRSFSFVTVLFFVNRYGTLLYPLTMQLMEMLPMAEISEERANAVCNGVLRFHEVLTITLELTVAIFMALRMYAIWASNRKVFALVLLLGLAPLTINIYYYTTVGFAAAPVPLAGCGENVHLRPSTASTLGIVNSTLYIANAALVLILTTIKMAGTMKLLHTLRIQTSLTSLTEILVQHGALYFGSLLIMNIINVVGAFTVPALDDIMSTSGIFSFSVTSVIISRFILNLRGVSKPNQASGGGSSSRFSSVRFMNYMAGNLGAPLHTGEQLEDADVTEDIQRSHDSLQGQTEAKGQSMLDETDHQLSVVDTRSTCSSNTV